MNVESIALKEIEDDLRSCRRTISNLISSKLPIRNKKRKKVEISVLEIANIKNFADDNQKRSSYIYEYEIAPYLKMKVWNN